jgi:hypothetical protein
MTPAANFATSSAGVVDIGGKFATGVNEAGGKLPLVQLELRISSRIFEKLRNGPNSIIRGLGETDLCKKPEVEILVTLSL